MEIKERINYWLDIAHYDLISAKAMLETKRYLYVGFFVSSDRGKELESLLKSFTHG